MVEFTSQDPHGFQLSAFLDHIRLGLGVDDTGAQRALDTAVVLFENWTGMLLRRTTVVQRADNHVPPFRAMYGPLIEGTTSVTKTDRTVDPAVVTDVTDSFYVMQDTHSYLCKLPSATVSYIRSSFVWTYDAGVTTVPPTARMAIHGIGALFYENRELANEARLETIPVGYRSIIETYRNGIL